MNARRVAIVAAVLSLGLSDASALAQSNCQHAKGQEVSTYDPVTNTNTGTLTNAGWLNGTTTHVFVGAVLPTADPTTVTFVSDFALATIHGELRASNVYLFDFVNGIAQAFARINPTTSTGAFAGATGVLHFGGRATSPTSVEAEMTGEVCFAQ